MPPSKMNSIPGGDIKVRSEVKTSSRPQQFSDILKQNPQSPHEHIGEKSQEKRKAKSPFRQPHFDEHYPVRRKGDRPNLQTRSLKCVEKPGNERKPNEKDELVKHMSNLPGYLQKVERGDNFKDNALNFGVLDWNRLKKWKYSDIGLPRGSADVSSSQEKRLPPSQSSRSYPPIDKRFSKDVNLSRMKVLETKFETSLRNASDEYKIPNLTNMPSSKSTSGTKPERGMRRDTSRVVVSENEALLSGFRKKELPKSTKDVTSGWRKVITSREELLLPTECLDKKSSPGEQKSLVLILPKHSRKFSSQDMVHTSEPTSSFDGKSKEANQETHSDEISSKEVRFESLLRSDSPIHSQSLELLNVGSSSSGSHKVSSRHKFTDTRTPKSKNLRGDGIETPRSSDYDMHESAPVKGSVASPSRRFSFSLGKISRSLSFKENLSVPEASTTPVNSDPIKSEPSHRLSGDEVHSSGELRPVHSCPLPTGRKTKDEPGSRLNNLKCVNETPVKQSSEDVIGPTEFDAVKGRYSSPNRRFGFSLSKMRRSFSFKDGLDTPQLASSMYESVKSGPVKSEVSDYSCTVNENKDSLRSKSRSSPLRRLLEPVLKTRVTYPCPSTETQNSNQVSGNEAFDQAKPLERMVQALLQVTVKNGLPLFKLVVNNSSDILVAMKNINPPGKQGVDSIYTFYSVHEIKKRSSWIGQVHKEKNYGFGYNAVGQMKGFSRFCCEKSVDNSEDKYTQKEFVLYNVERKQGNGEAPELVPIRELASIIVRVPHGNLNDDVEERNIGKELTGKEFLEYLEEEKYLFGKGESEKFHKTTVILSGADHSLPKNGVPSSLIQRWRSGGSCDCGGWDVGCKLRILTNEEQRCAVSEPSVSSSNQDHFDLFIQGEARKDKPIFRLAPFKKGIYSIEFSTSISLLQALSTCIAAITSQQSFDISQLTFQYEGKLIEESTYQGCPSRAQELPGKNVPFPPLSPVGRV